MPHHTTRLTPKNWQLSGISAAVLTTVLAAQAVYAQTADQSKYIRQKTNTTELQKLANQLQQKFEADEAAVAAYLLANPGVARTQMINGKPHTIVRIGADGQPEFQVPRDMPVKSGTVLQKNTESASLIKADRMYNNAGGFGNITGQNMVAGVWEPGLPRFDHELLLGQSSIAVTTPAQEAPPADLPIDPTNVGNRNHASHVTGTMVGKDFSSDPNKSEDAKSARGIAYGATAKNWTASNDLAEMIAAASNVDSPLLVSNHSYGDANTQTANLWKYGAYDAEARNWDAMLSSAKMYLPFIAGGNEQQSSGNPGKGGYDIMTGSSASKNAMTVGAVNANKTMSDYSNWGPTDDGRVKPEIVARGTGINSAQAFDANSAASTTAYSGSDPNVSSGTSYAAPAAAAGALLLQQYYNSLNPGKYMLASTLKSLIMGTAEDLGQPGPDYKFGYGLMNVEAAAKAIKNNSTTVTGTNCAHGTATGTACTVTVPNSKGALVYEWKANPTPDNATTTNEMTFAVTAKGGTPLIVNLGWTDDESTAQTAGDGVDDTGTDPNNPRLPTSRMVYDFDIMVRGPGFVDTRSWVLPGMANRTNDATKTPATGAGWFQGNGGPFRQVIVASPNANDSFTIYVRKKAGSPTDMRTLSLVVTGMADSNPVAGACNTTTTSTPTVTAPVSANLCSAGTSSAVTAGASSWGWTCSGTGGSTSSATCTAPYASTGGSSGATGAVSTPTNNWVVNTASFNGAPSQTTAPPAGASFPLGVLNLTLTNPDAAANGRTTTVDVTFSQPIPPNAQFYKYGKRSAGGNPEWYVFSGARLKDGTTNTVTLTLTDGPGMNTGDNDQMENNRIEDPFAVLVFAQNGGGAATIPTLGEWALMGLSSLLLLLGLRQVGRSNGRRRQAV